MNPLFFPKLEKYINDFSGVLNQEKSHLINELFAEHERKTGEQIVVVLFPHRQGNELLEIGLKIFNENGIGEKNLNNGLLLIIATDEKKIRIVTGKGMELKYTEMICRDIIENQLRSLLNAGEYQELIEIWQGITMNNLINNPLPEEQKILGHNPQELQNIFEKIGKGDNSPKVSIIAMILIIPLSIVGIILILLVGMNGIALMIPLITYAVYKNLDTRLLKNKTSTHSYIIFVILLLMIASLIGMSYICAKNGCLISGGTPNGSYTRSSNGGDYSSSYDSSSSSDSSSSFGGGGGSSNGGGYGD